MQNLFKFKRLNFLTAGMPLRTGKGSYSEAFDILTEMQLDGIELEFVHGVRMSEATRKLVKEKAKEKNLILTAHAPYYINLNSKEEEKVEASVERILQTAKAGDEVGAYSIVFHAAFYMGEEKEVVYKKVLKQTERIVDVLERENIKVWVRPETTGKATQWGDIDEIIALSKEFKHILPCVDFSHLHARTNGGLNTYDDFMMLLEKVAGIGQYAIDNFHAHAAGIAYSEKGEKHHLVFAESDMNYKDLLKAMKNFGVKGVLTCESPNIEDDCRMLKDYYMSL